MQKKKLVSVNSVGQHMKICFHLKKTGVDALSTPDQLKQCTMEMRFCHIPITKSLQTYPKQN